MLRLVQRQLLPTATLNCHASTVAIFHGRLAAAWFGGTREGADDVGIWFSREEESGWTEPVCLSPKAALPHWNPVLLVRPDGSLRLFMKEGKPIACWYTLYTDSSDGIHWTEPAELVPGDRGGRGPVKNKCLRLTDGALLAPASLEEGRWRAFVDRSEDGEHFTPEAIPCGDEADLIQPSLWESKPGHVHAFLRSNSGFIYRTDSQDGGRSFCPAYPTNLPNNNSGLDLTRLEDGTLLLVCNPVSGNWAARTPLSVLISRDNGGHWEKALDLETEEGEFSYPAIIAEGKNVYISYTHRREHIALCRLTLESSEAMTKMNGMK